MAKPVTIASKFLRSIGLGPARRKYPVDKIHPMRRNDRIFKSNCVVGTFHKTGTVLMASILRQLDRQADFGIWHLARDSSEPERWQVAFDAHSRFAEEPVNVRTMPCVVVIRDPRDVVISAAHYHTHSRESWLHQPLDKFDGQTYQEKINSLPDWTSRFGFEMRNSAAAAIESMLQARAADAHANTMFVKLEDLVADVELKHFEMLFGHLALDPAYMPLALETARNCSLFSGKTVKRKHVRSGLPAQWKTNFDSALNAEFTALFPDAVERLGYLDAAK